MDATALRTLILRLTAGDHAAFLALPALRDVDWRHLNHLADLHHLTPILHANRGVHGKAWPVPSAVGEVWRNGYRASALAVMAHEHALRKISRLLNEIGEPFAALKGSWVALNRYDHPALRPMRDIDILVHPERARDVFALFRAHGYELAPFARYQPGEESALPERLMGDGNKHLPPLVCPDTRVCVELHFRLFLPNAPGRPDSFDDPSSLLDRRIYGRIGDAVIPYLSETDCLLHLIVHSVYEHGFDNGPLVLNDIAVLIDRGDIDWQAFWNRARGGRWTRGCALALRLVERFFGSRAFWRPADYEEVTEDVVCAAIALLLTDDIMNGPARLLAQLSSGMKVGAKLALVARRIAPTPDALFEARGKRIPQRSAWRLYPHWALTHLRRMAAVMASAASRRKLRHEARLATWLRGPARGC